MLQGNKPGAACMYEIHRKDEDKRAVFEIETKGKSSAHHTSAVSSCAFW